MVEEAQWHSKRGQGIMAVAVAIRWSGHYGSSCGDTVVRALWQ